MGALARIHVRSPGHALVVTDNMHVLARIRPPGDTRHPGRDSSRTRHPAITDR
jgi:hypothetical protein